eukprot:2042885-Pyramimonas_sp.AAC.1
MTPCELCEAAYLAELFGKVQELDEISIGLAPGGGSPSYRCEWKHILTKLRMVIGTQIKSLASEKTLRLIIKRGV